MPNHLQFDLFHRNDFPPYFFVSTPHTVYPFLHEFRSGNGVSFFLFRSFTLPPVTDHPSESTREDRFLSPISTPAQPPQDHGKNHKPKRICLHIGPLLAVWLLQKSTTVCVNEIGKVRFFLLSSWLASVLTLLHLFCLFLVLFSLSHFIFFSSF